MGFMFLSFQFRENTDILRYKDWGRISFLYGPADTYNSYHLSFGTLPNNQPPGSLYIINSMYFTQIQASKILMKIFNFSPGEIPWINIYLPDIFLRIPSIFADILIGLIIYNLIKTKKGRKEAIIYSSIFLFNPVIIYNSSFWGQMDSLNNLFLLLSILFLIKKRYFLSLFFIFTSLYIKLSLIFILPLLLLIIFLKLKQKIKLILFLLLIFIFLFILTIPISANPSWFLNFAFENAKGEMQNITNFAFNFWWFIFKPHLLMGPTKNMSFSEILLTNSPSSLVKFGLSLETWAYLLSAIFSLPLFFKILKNKEEIFSNGKIFLYISLLAFIGFMFLPKMHERYIYPVFPLLTIYIGFNKAFVYFLIPLIILNFINLYFVWHPFLPLLFPFWAMNNLGFQWNISFLTLIIFAFFYIKTLIIK